MGASVAHTGRHGLQHSDRLSLPSIVEVDSRERRVPQAVQSRGRSAVEAAVQRARPELKGCWRAVTGARGVGAIVKHLGLGTAGARLAPARGPHKAAWC